MRLRALVALGLASLGLAFLTPVGNASAASAPLTYPVGQCSTLSVSTQNPNPGQAITVTGTNFAPSASVHLILTKGSASSSNFFNLGTFTTDARGSFSAQVTLPSAVTNKGNYKIYAITGVSTTQSSTCPPDPVQVIAFATNGSSSSANGSTGGTTGGGTAGTGFDIAALVVLAAGLLGVGYYVNRRGRRSASRV